MRNTKRNEAGVALIMVMLLMLIFSIIIIGFYFETTGEERVAASDYDNAQTYYAAQGAIENMSSDIASLFAATPSPSVSQINGLTAASYQPTIAGVTFPTGGYTIGQPPNNTLGATLTSTTGIVPGTGPLAGLMGIITPFTLTVIADGPNNTEVKMTRQVQEVAVPVFQYGIFSQTDLSFYAGPNFTFGGRTATNGNLFLAEGAGDTLTLNDKVTAYLAVVRTMLPNGNAVGNNSSTGNVDITINSAGGCPTPTCPACPTATCRALGAAEGSVTGGPGSAANAAWQNLSMSTYKGYIRSGSTGVKQLNLALALAGASPVAMIQRPPAGENPASLIGQQRFFNQASVRILLSDTQAQITGVPGVTANAPYPLAEGAASGMANVIQRTVAGNPYYLPATDACHPPIAESPGYAADNDYMSPNGTTLLGGYIKVEVQLNAAPGTWQDVTQEVLSLGISHNTMTQPYNVNLQTPTVSNNAASALANTTYYYVITATGPNIGESLASAEVNKSTGATKKQLTVSWTSVPGATGYRLYRGTAAGGENGYYTVAGGGTTSYVDTGAAFTATPATPPAACTNMSILHLQEAIPGMTLGTTSYTQNTNYIPVNMYDPREGEVRDPVAGPYPTQPSLNGIMNLVEVDVGHLQQWLANTLCNAGTVPNSCPSGALALNNSGYILYISDRRGNCNQAAATVCTGNDTGELGNEDIINPASAAGTPNGVLDSAAAGTGACAAGGPACPIEDLDGDGVFRTYGATPHPLAIDAGGGASPFPALLATMPATNPAFTRVSSGPVPCTASAGCVAQKNSVVMFRHGVRLEDGILGNLPPLAAATLVTCPNAAAPATFPAGGGFSLATENPAYVFGDYNASSAVGAWTPDPSGKCHVPAAIFADAVTLLSNGYTDAGSFNNPDNNLGSASRAASETWWRVAIIAGKSNNFPLPTFAPAPKADFGTDGGTHNFLRYIENWGGVTANYLGSMVSFYIARQGTGVFKCCQQVYGAPGARNYSYDTDFTNIGSLPPGTPRFTTVNALSYQQTILSTH